MFRAKGYAEIKNNASNENDTTNALEEKNPKLKDAQEVQQHADKAVKSIKDYVAYMEKGSSSSDPQSQVRAWSLQASKFHQSVNEFIELGQKVTAKISTAVPNKDVFESGQALITCITKLHKELVDTRDRDRSSDQVQPMSLSLSDEIYADPRDEMKAMKIFAGNLNSMRVVLHEAMRKTFAFVSTYGACSEEEVVPLYTYKNRA